MDPIVLSAATAVVAAATAVGNGVVSAAGKDAYERLKRLICGRFAAAESALLEVEKAPAQGGSHAVLVTRLVDVGAAEDAEFRRCVEALCVALRQEPETLPLFDVLEVELTKSLKVNNVSTAGTVLRARKIVAESMDLRNIHQIGDHQTRETPEKH